MTRIESIGYTRSIPRMLPMLRFSALLALLLFGTFASAEKPSAIGAAFIDDEKILDGFTKKLGTLAGDGKCVFGQDIAKKTAERKATKLEAAKPSDKALSPIDLADRIEASVFLIGSVAGTKEKGFEQGRMATAWVASADGLLITNAHVFEEIGDDEHFGAMDRAGEAYAMTDLVAVDRDSDVAVFRIEAKGLTPLPLATAPAKRGSWVGLMSHPGDRYFTFTQGHVTRYSKYKDEANVASRWMDITADYASGSSGGPVVDACGNVVGMAAFTQNIDAPEEGNAAAVRKPMLRKKAKRDEPKKDPPDLLAAPQLSTVQMVVKSAVPASEIAALLGGK